MAEKTRGFAVRVDINADVARIWRALTDTAALSKWLSPDARIAAREGGSFQGAIDRRNPLIAHIDVFEPGRRMRLIHLSAAGLPSFDGAIVDDLLLLPGVGEPTVVRLLGSGYPAEPPFEAYYTSNNLGWRQSLARLKVYLEKGLDK
jgi:uncharacterized protein YndB with AHSA1/START domain